MRTLLRIFVLLLLFTPRLSAQTFGNEWIVYSQKYLKIKVTQDGLYRLDSATLANSLASVGASLATIDPRNFQLFSRGQENYIYVSGETDGAFNTGDFIEFFGQANDGYLDSLQYYGAANQPNPYMSLYNDTSVYFLTWNASLANRRLVVDNDTSFASYTPAPYFTNLEFFSGRYQYFNGESDAFGITDPQFIPTEGFMDQPFGYGGSVARALNTRNAYTSGPDARITMKVASHSNDFSSLGDDNFIRIQFGSTQLDTSYDGYKTGYYSFLNPAAALGTSTTFTVSSLNNNASISSGLTAIGYIDIRYPHTFDLEGRSWFAGKLPDNQNAPKSLLEISNINAGSSPVRVYDFFNHKRIDAVFANGVYKALVPNGNGSEKSFVMAAESSVQNITQLVAVNGTGTFTDFSSQLGDSSFVLVTHRKLWSSALDYQQYRQSAAGGAHHVVLADVSELYDQFAHGIGKNPQGIRRFSDFLIHQSPSKPKYLLLLGKSIYGEYARSATYYSSSLVPSYGYPPSDNALTAGLDGTLWEPAIATGRIAAPDTVQANWYLDKVRDYENNTAEEWMKYVLHFGGGTGSGEQAVFASYLSNYERIIEDTLFGGTVQTFLKTSSAPIQINQSDSLRQRIEAGVSIMTFFGHASGTGFDQSIDDPSTYNNQDHYPFLIANSCYAGDLHSPGISSSELFVLIEDKGVIGYVASVGVGLSGYLDQYTFRLYEAIGQTNYGQSAGSCIKQTVYRTQNALPYSIQIKSTCLEMTLHGDPAVVINAHDKPDYAIQNSDVWFDQTSDLDTITVYAKMTNLGRAINDTIIVQLARSFPNGDTATVFLQVPTPTFRDTLAFRIPVDFQRGIGLNRIRISLDFYGQIPELLETNNTTIPDIDLLINGKSLVPIWPYEYAVIPTDTITLKASTADPLEPIRTYRFEMDTTDLFNSPFLQTTLVAAPGGVVSWKPPVTFTDSTVYFWRVSPDSISPSDRLVWRETSFQYIVGKTGWSQAHYFQFKNDDYQYVTYNRPQRSFEFVNDIKTLQVKNGMYGVAVPWNEVWYKINGATQHIFSCGLGMFGLPGVSIAVFDPVSGNPWSFSDTIVHLGPNGNAICVTNQTLYAYDFVDVDSTWRPSMTSFLNSIPTGYKVLIYSQHYHNAPRYENALYNAIENIGSNQIRNISDTTSFIIFGTQGGAMGTAHEVVGTSQTDIIYLNDSLVTNWNDGYIRSTIIGPAQTWGSLHWRQTAVEQPDGDEVELQVLGYTSVSALPVLLHTFPEDSIDVLNLSVYANAQQYPYLQLLARMKDDTSRTPPQMDRWQVLYAPVPEAALHPPLAFSFYNDTLQEGDSLRLTLGVKNVSDYSFTDSLLVSYWIVDANRVVHNLPDQLRVPPFAAGTSFIDSLVVSTTGFAGENELWLEVNPIGKPKSQLEQYHFNNVLKLPFYIGTDRINPLMDVTFDGVHILNGDIVSARPQILIQLKDENQFLALNDTADFRIFMRAPSQQTAQIMPWGSVMQFTPAVLPNNSCKIFLSPLLTEDGVYELIIQAKDRSNNNSGFLDYKIQFEVVNKPSITNVLNYPNPFTSSTKFVFTLTGSEIPQIFTIQIMTITGKVVREIDQDELGPMHIGRNITEYAWDGRDEFGDPLANGVYLYRIITRLNDSEIEHRASGADTYITQGVGKMYLMR
jgi:hypothetical protein